MGFLRCVALVLLAGCGGSAVIVPLADAGANDASSPAEVDASDDAAPSADAATDASGSACEPSAAIGKACTPGQMSCDRVDECCTESFVCEGPTRTWKGSGVACLQCEGFPCGEKKCTGGQVCLARGSGVQGGTTSYECAPMPAACSRQWTCDCVSKNVGPGCTVAPSNGCTESGFHVSISCMGI